jgi:hypothetical protein
MVLPEAAGGYYGMSWLDLVSSVSCDPAITQLLLSRVIAEYQLRLDSLFVVLLSSLSSALQPYAIRNEIALDVAEIFGWHRESYFDLCTTALIWMWYKEKHTKVLSKTLDDLNFLVLFSFIFLPSCILKLWNVYM